MPSIQVALAEIGEKCQKTYSAGEQQGPPCPRSSNRHWEFGQPNIAETDGQERTALGYSVVEHKAEQMSISSLHQRHGVHPDCMAVVRKYLSGDSLKHGKPAT